MGGESPHFPKTNHCGGTTHSLYVEVIPKTAGKGSAPPNYENYGRLINDQKNHLTLLWVYFTLGVSMVKRFTTLEVGHWLNG